MAEATMRPAKRAMLLLAGALIALTGACVQDIKQDRTHVALVNAGITDPTAACMAHRMAEKLTIAQLRHLAALGGPKQSWRDYVAAVQRVNDPDALEVLLSSFALCKAGLAH